MNGTYRPIILIMSTDTVWHHSAILNKAQLETRTCSANTDTNISQWMGFAFSVDLSLILHKDFYHRRDDGTLRGINRAFTGWIVTVRWLRIVAEGLLMIKHPSSEWLERKSPRFSANMQRQSSSSSEEMCPRPLQLLFGFSPKRSLTQRKETKVVSTVWHVCIFSFG